MTEPYCSVTSCEREFVHYHCPKPGCDFVEEYLRLARVHGGEIDWDKRSGFFMKPGDGPHPEILVGLPPLCKWVVMVEVNRSRDALKKGKEIYFPRGCEYEEGHKPHGSRKDGHNFGYSTPKNAKAFLPGADGKPVEPPAPKQLPEGLTRKTSKKCPDCGDLSTEEDPLEVEPRYECSCGNEFNRSESDSENHICPDCHKFASKLTEEAHVDCGGNMDEAEEVSILVCIHCEEEFEEDEAFDEAVEHVKEHGGN